MKKKYDIAAYVWPAYTGDEQRTRIFWPEGMGEWQSVKNAVEKRGQRKDEISRPRKPLWGYVNEADPQVMKMEIETALKYGVNIFIYDWYWYDGRPYLENCLNDGFLKAENSGDMRFYLMWANHDQTSLLDIRTSDLDTVIWRGSIGRSEFEKITERLVRKYFTLPNYYRIDSSPVFSVYDINNLVTGLGSISDTRKALDAFRSITRRVTGDGLHLQLIAYAEQRFAFPLDSPENICTYTTSQLAEELGFDSITNYQFAHLTNIDRDYLEILDDVEKEWERIDRECRVPYYTHVSVGWDNNPRFIKFRPGIVRNNTPENFEKALRLAKKRADRCNVPLITINSWNEWTETSYLEPDDLYEYGYLEAIKRVFCDEK